MPLYEFVCQVCSKKFTFLAGMMVAGNDEPECPDCGSKELTKLVSRVHRVAGTGSGFEGRGRLEDRSVEHDDEIP